MSSLINPRNQQGLRYLFDIADPKSNPERIEMASIQPTIDMSFGGYAKLSDFTQLQSQGLNGVSLNGVQTFTNRILSYGNSTGIDPQIIIPIGFCAIIWGMKVHVSMSAGDAAANAGKYLQQVIKLIIPTIGVNNDITKWSGAWKIDSNMTLYQPGSLGTETIHRGHLSVIPPSCGLEITTWWESGVNFPASTTLTYHIGAQCFPVGAPLPMGI